MELISLLDAMHAQESLDLHLVAGETPRIRVSGELRRLDAPALEEVEIKQMLASYLTPRDGAMLEQLDDLDRVIRSNGRSYAAHLFHERSHLSASIRVIPAKVPTLDELYEHGRVAELLRSLVKQPSGLIIITGHTGSGKLMTLAAMIDAINATLARKILIIDQVMQFEYTSRESLITHRVIGADTPGYRDAARSAFREDADVVQIGEMLDLETLSLALTLADTGRLVLLPVHCKSAAEAITRLADVFPEPRGHIRRLLARNLLAVVAQALLPRADRVGRIAVNEVLLPTPQIREMIADGIEGLDQAIADGRAEGMQTMDDAILEVLNLGAVSAETARARMEHPERITA